MSFLHWWPLYVGAAAAALPLAVHWLTKPRPIKFPVSTLRFIRAAVEQRRARHRLRDFLVLALRTAAVGLLAWAVARPLASSEVAFSNVDEDAIARVVVLDVSQSMAAGHRGIPAFERARSRAAEYLGYRADMQANLIQAAAAPRPVFDQLSTNFDAFRDELADARVEPQRLNVRAALHLASQMLASVPADGRRRELILISDFQRSNWTDCDFSVLSQDTKITLESVAEPQPPANLAILRVACQGRPALGKQTRLEVEIGNYSAAPERAICEVTLDSSSFRMEGVCPANGTATLTQDMVLPSAGWQIGAARLVDHDDALASDNVRPFVVDVRPAPTYAFLTRQPPAASGSSTFYLERALSPYGARNRRDEAHVVRIDPAQADDQALASAEVIIVDHPGRLSSEAIGLLASLLRRGRAVLFLTAESIDAMNLKQLADAAGSALQMPVEFAPAETGRPRHNLFLADLKASQSPFSILGDSLNSAMGALRFGGGLASHGLDTGLGDDLLAVFSDRSAALVVSSCGAGVLAVLNADLGSSNLPASPWFVPLLQELIDRLLAQKHTQAAVASGESMSVYLPAEVESAAGLTITTPVGSATVLLGELSNESAGVVWHASAAPPPGVYRVSRGTETVFALASETPPEESDLRTLSPSVFKERLAGGRAIGFRGTDQSGEQSDTNWIWLAAAAVVAMLLELAVLRISRV